MQFAARLAVCLPLVLGGCAVSSKTFYADSSKPNDTELCRVALDPGADPQFRQDVTDELIRRGMTGESCTQKIGTQNAVGVAALLIGLAAATVIACNNNACPSGGGGYAAAPPMDDVDCAGGSGDGPRFVQGPFYMNGQPDVYDLDRDRDGIACEIGDDYF